MPYSCYRRSLYITEDWSCVLAFLRCCAEYRGEELGVVTRPPTTTPPPTPTPVHTTTKLNSYRPYVYHYPSKTIVSEPSILERIRTPEIVARENSHADQMKEEEEEVEEFDEDDLADLEDIYVRSKFFESWLWTDIRLPSVTKSDG